ncbi:LysR family transcriptional regulator [Labilithrix luteola]|nr:LysR family transcriptional regulator [Labilithrix luteola]
MIDSDRLHAFAVFAEDANLSRAAARLHLSQPAVHAQIRKLSEELGVPLYRRVGRGLSLTKEGAELAAYARETEERASEFVARLKGEGAERRVVLAAGAGALLHVLGPALRSFTRAFSGRLDVVTADGPTAVGLVARGEAHVGVAALDATPLPSLQDESLELRSITDVKQLLVVPTSHPLAKKRHALLADLEGERLVLPPRGRPQRVALEAAFAARGVTIREGALATGWDLVVHLVSLGIGLAIVNGSVRLPAGLVGLTLRELPPIRYVAFARRRPRPDPAALLEAMTKQVMTKQAPGKRG